MNLLIAITLAASTAASTPAANPKEADDLFKKARALIKEGKQAQACPLFEKSHALDPALGTLLNIADCYEATGRLVQAFLSFNEASAWAGRNHETSREEIARARAAALKDRLSWLAISTTNPAPGLVVSVNDFVVELTGAAQSVPVDAGKVKLVARAPGREPWSSTVVAWQKQTVAVVVPQLTVASELRKPAELKTLEAALPPAPMVTVEAAAPPPPPPPAAVAEAPVSVTRTAPASSTRGPGVVLLASGVAVTAAGVAGLVWTYETHARFERQQPGQVNAASPTVTREQFETMRWMYPASWVAAGVGAAMAVTGVVLVAKGGSSATVAVVPTPSGGTLAVSGTF
jgi:hypothetical protein